MKFFNSLAVLALVAINPAEAVKTSLMREHTDIQRELRNKGKSSSKSSKGKGKSSSSSAAAPRCPATGSSSSSKGKGKSSSSKGKGKSSSSDEDTTRALFERELRAKGKSSGGKGKGKSSSGGSYDGCDCDGPQDTCTEPDSTVDCNDYITDYRILSTSLRCDYRDNAIAGDEANIAVILDGPDAVLECDGDGDNGIFGSDGTSSDSVGVLLLNGATLKNCNIAGFGINVQMGYDCTTCTADKGISNTVTTPNLLLADCDTLCTTPSTQTVSNVNSFGGGEGVQVQGNFVDDCFAIECSQFYANRQAGALINGAGDVIIANSEFSMNGSRGIQIIPGVTQSAYVAIEDTNIVRNGGGTQLNDLIGTGEGVLVGDAMRARSYGMVTLEWFRKNEVLNNLGRGIWISAMGMPTNNVDGQLKIEHNGIAGYQQDIGTTTISEGALLYSCQYNYPVGTFDIQVAAGATFTAEDDTEIACDGTTLSGLPAATCTMQCGGMTITSAAACEDDGSSTSSKGKGKSSKGKSSSKGKGKSSSDTP